MNDATEENVLNRSVFEHIAKSRSNRARLQILIVEDDEFSRKLVTRILHHDYELLEAADGESAIKQYALNAPDMVFLDFELPDMTGLDILQKINHVDDYSYVVMLTSHTDSTIVQNAISEGAKGYIAKPFEKEKIVAYIEKCKSEKI